MPRGARLIACPLSLSGVSAEFVNVAELLTDGATLLRLQAEQALKKWSLFGGGDKYEDAADKYQRAGHAYKAAKAC